MTNPCYDFALRPKSKIPNSCIGRRHTRQRRTSPVTPSSQESFEELESSRRQRSDRGRWKTDGRINIVRGFEDSNTPSCQCHRCAGTRKINSYFSDAYPSRRTRTPRGPSSSGNCLDQLKGGRKSPPPVPKGDHCLWNPMQLLRRPNTSTEREQEEETSRLSHRSCKNWSSLSRPRFETSSKSRYVRESNSPNRVPLRSSKVQYLRRTPLQQRKPSPRKSPPGRCSGSNTASLGSRRRSYISPSPTCKEKFDRGCQTRRDEFPLTPEETPRASPIRRVIASDSFYHDRSSHNLKSFSFAGQRRPSPCRCGAAACAPLPTRAATRGCCCSVCVGWQERTQSCPKPVVPPQASCQSNRHGNCCAAVACHQGNQHQSCCEGSHHGVCSRAAELQTVRQNECSKCHQSLPPIK